MTNFPTTMTTFEPDQRPNGVRYLSSVDLARIRDMRHDNVLRAIKASIGLIFSDVDADWASQRVGGRVAHLIETPAEFSLLPGLI